MKDSMFLSEFKRLALAVLLESLTVLPLEVRLLNLALSLSSELRSLRIDVLADSL